MGENTTKNTECDRCGAEKLAWDGCSECGFDSDELDDDGEW
jgi:hypothetical protein